MVKKYPQVMIPSLDYYEASRIDKFKNWWERIRCIREDPEFAYAMTRASELSNYKGTPWFFQFPGTYALTYHQMMVMEGVKNICSDE